MGLVVALSDATVNLLSALLGALVGGIATLIGSIIVNRRERAMDARLRLYDELIPAAKDAWGAFVRHQGISVLPYDTDTLHNELIESLHAVRRASVVAGRQERRAADKIVYEWRQSSQLLGEVAISATMLMNAKEWEDPKTEESRARRKEIEASKAEAITKRREVLRSLDQLVEILERRLD